MVIGLFVSKRPSLESGLTGGAVIFKYEHPQKTYRTLHLQSCLIYDVSTQTMNNLSHKLHCWGSLGLQLFIAISTL